MLTQSSFDRAEIEARELGTERGAAVASWYEIDEGNAVAILRGIEDGDPAILDTFPSAPLSGERAGDPLPQDILAEIGAADASPEDADALLTAYEDAFYAESQSEIERRARWYTED